MQKKTAKSILEGQVCLSFVIKGLLVKNKYTLDLLFRINYIHIYIYVLDKFTWK